MLDSLDTLIAFAVIFAIVSMLITIVVQMTSSFLNLRGRNLAWGIAEAFETINPELSKAVQASAGTWYEKFMGRLKQYLPKKLFPPKSEAKHLADHCLNDTLLSDFQFAGMHWSGSAVRADELFGLLHRIATGRKPDAPAEMQERVIELFKALGVDANVFRLADAERRELQSLKTDIEGKLNGLPDGPAKTLLTGELQKVSNRLANAARDVEGCALRWAAQGEAAIQGVYQKFEHWFETGQERSQEWFTTHARIVTVALGLLFAFWLQLDAVDIFKLVSSNREVRAKLVAQATNVQKQAEQILGNQKSVLDKALAAWKEDLKAPAKDLDAIKNLNARQNENRDDLIAHAKTALGSTPEIDKLLDDLGAKIDAAGKKAVNDEAKSFVEVKGDLDNTGFSLFPKSGWRWPETNGELKKIHEFKGGWNYLNPKFLPWFHTLRQHYYVDHFWGMFFSALLLSLGAPFWFNVLKSLASLRSSVADNISDEKKADEKSGDANKPAKAPVPVLPTK